MFSPAILGVCCLAGMAPALTKAVRQADGLTLFLMPQRSYSLVPSKIDHLSGNDCTAALNGPGKSPRAYKGGSVNNGNFFANGEMLHFKTLACNRSLENVKLINTNGFKNTILNTGARTVNNVNGHCSYVGGPSPAYDSGDFLNKMNEDTTVVEERMGFLNANTSLENDYQTKNFSHQCLSPVSSNMSPNGCELVKDIPTKSPVDSILSPLGSPKSASGESTSTVTTHNPQVVTFTELEEVKLCHKSLANRVEELLLRLRKLQVFQLDRHMSNQLKALISHYQRTLSIPCQRQVRQNGSRRIKDAVELKTGLLQSENVRSLSTAALVNLVHSIELSNHTSSKVLLSNKNSSEIEDSIIGEKGDVKLDPVECEQVRQAVGSLLMRVNHLELAMDSDVTESSSGGESSDECDGSDDKKTISTPLQKRAVWMWANDRAPIAKRWTWLQSQVQDLEYRVRQFADLLLQARGAKGEICFEAPSKSDTICSPDLTSTSIDRSLLYKKELRAVNGCLGGHAAVVASSSGGLHSMCGVSSSSELSSNGLSERNIGHSPIDDCSSVSRTRPRVISSFRKRKLLRTSGLHVISKKAARLANIKCNCNSRLDAMPCILCGGRYNNMQSVDPNVMPLLERVALLQPTFHPMLSLEKDISVALHFENHLRKSEKYYSIPKSGPSPVKKAQFGLQNSRPRGLMDHARHHSRKLAKHAAQTLLSSERYRNNRHLSHGSSKLNNQGFSLKKWRDVHKGTLKSKRYKSWSVTSNCSSRQESPLHLPSAFEDGLLFNSLSGKDSSFQDMMKKRRDEHHFDIDNVIIPYDKKTVSQTLQYKEIVTPGWRHYEHYNLCDELEANEDLSEETIRKRHDKSEADERKHNLRISTQLGLGGIRKGRRRYLFDSHADSSGANTPDHLSYYPHDIVFQDSNSFIASGRTSPTLSPPATPGSLHTMSDDSQPPSSHAVLSSSERRRTTSWNSSLKRDKSVEETITSSQDVVVHQPFETRVFPLSDKEYEEMLKVSEEALNELDEINQEAPVNAPSSPGSIDTSSSTSSAFEDEDDETADPEWTVVQRQNEHNSTLILKLAKR